MIGYQRCDLQRCFYLVTKYLYKLHERKPATVFPLTPYDVTANCYHQTTFYYLVEPIENGFSHTEGD